MLKDMAKEEKACIKMTQKQDINPAVGPALSLDVNNEGVSVVSMVDCGSPSTIITTSSDHTTDKK